MDEPPGDPRPASCRGACSSSAAARRAASSPRSTPVRRAGHDRPVRIAGSRRPITRATPRRSEDALRARTASRCGPACARVRARAERCGRRRPRRSTSTTATTARATRCCSRSGGTSRSSDLGLEHYGADRRPEARPVSRATAGSGSPTACGCRRPRRSRAPHHQAHYQGELAVRMALGEDVAPDYRALPRATYTDPEAASSGLPSRGTRGRRRRVRVGRRLPDEREGLRGGGDGGHVTIVVDRASGELVGAAIAWPGASRRSTSGRRDPGARPGRRRSRRRSTHSRSTSRDLRRAVRRRRRRELRRRRPGTRRPAVTPRARRGRRRGRATAAGVASRPPGSTGSSTAAAGTTTRSAREPGTRRPRRLTGEGRGPMHAARSAGRDGSVRPAPKTGTRRHAGRARDGECDARPGIDGLDGRVGAESDDGAGLEERAQAEAVSLRALAAPRSSAFARSERRWIGWIEAAMRPAANRGRSADLSQLDVFHACHGRPSLAPAAGGRRAPRGARRRRSRGSATRSRQPPPVPPARPMCRDR